MTLNLDDTRAVIAQVATEFPADGLVVVRSAVMRSTASWARLPNFRRTGFYPTVEEKAANLVYLVVKDHPLADGNKRSAAALFVTFLARNDALTDAAGHPRSHE